MKPAAPWGHASNVLRVLRRTGLVLALLLGLGATVLVALRHRHPDISAWQARVMPEAAPAAGALRLRWLGVSTLLISDGETALLTDGFFSRPGALQTLLTPLQPNDAAIRAALAALGIQRLAAVIPLHSHYDHAMDSARVAALTGADLLASASSANLARGQGFDASRIRQARDGDRFRYGAFDLQLLRSAHIPRDHMPGEIAQPLAMPARVHHYKTGESWSLFITHRGRRLLVQGSAGFIPGSLAGQQADAALLGIGLLGKMDAAYRAAYWRETAQAVGARRVIAIHWDDFFQPLTRPLQPMPNLADNVVLSLQTLQTQAQHSGVDFRLPPDRLWFDPFAGL